MKYAVKDGRISRNPCEDVQLPRVVKSERRYLTPRTGLASGECSR